MPNDARTLPPHAVELGVPQLLHQLRYAHVCAEEVGDNAWEFALQLEDMARNGLTDAGLRWLIRNGYAQHALETTKPNAKTRSFLSVEHMRFLAESCFILTPTGIQLTQQLPPNGNAGGQLSPLPGSPGRGAAVPISPLPGTPGRGVGGEGKEPNAEELARLEPVWLPDRRELRLGEYLVKKYRQPAKNQQLILQVFQEEGWPFRIDNPIPPERMLDGLARLHSAVRRLNEQQQRRLLRFHSDGNGEGVSWEIGV